VCVTLVRNRFYTRINERMQNRAERAHHAMLEVFVNKTSPAAFLSPALSIRPSVYQINQSKLIATLFDY